jgi:hypothetical protein
MLKKLLLSLWVAWILWLWSFAMVNALDNVDFNNGGNGLNQALEWQAAGQWINTIWTGSDAQWWLIAVIKNFINWVLWILSLIVLIICLRGWFQMVTASWDEEKYKKGFKILKQAWLGLVVIWLSWFIVTIVFWLLRNTTV